MTTLSEVPPWAKVQRAQLWGKRLLGRVALSPPLSLEVATTPAQQKLGLSERQLALPAHSGMLFIFKKMGRHGIWMRRTFFDLDVSWLDDGGRIVDLRTLTAFNEQTVEPVEAARFVLELPAGSHQLYQLQRGDWLVSLP